MKKGVVLSGNESLCMVPNMGRFLRFHIWGDTDYFIALSESYCRRGFLYTALIAWRWEPQHQNFSIKSPIQIQELEAKTRTSMELVKQTLMTLWSFNVVTERLRIRMEEEIFSVISNGGTSVMAEASDSNSSSCPFNGSTCTKQGTNASSGRFKGVVPQQNGHWGAQIYANHQRIWLGTYKSETEAAMAYDSAAIKLRSGDNHRNFPWSNLTIQEPSFQSVFSTETVVNMIKDGSYPSKFAEFLKSESHKGETKALGLDQAGMCRNGKFMCRLLFQKELTPSDVGKLNRLVIPKKYALKHFPPISESGKEIDDGDTDTVDDMQLFFYDRLMRLWKFRYCYWRSSQSFVFTRGWNRFVKEKELNANDVIFFYICEYGQGTKEDRTFCMIDVAYERDTNGKDTNNASFVQWPNQYTGLQVELQKDLKEIISKDNEPKPQEKVESLAAPAAKGENKGLRLFGVQIG